MLRDQAFNIKCSDMYLNRKWLTEQLDFCFLIKTKVLKCDGMEDISTASVEQW